MSLLYDFLVYFGLCWLSKPSQTSISMISDVTNKLGIPIHVMEVLLFFFKWMKCCFAAFFSTVNYFSKTRKNPVLGVWGWVWGTIFIVNCIKRVAPKAP